MPFWNILLQNNHCAKRHFRCYNRHVRYWNQSRLCVFVVSSIIIILVTKPTPCWLEPIPPGGGAVGTAHRGKMYFSCSFCNGNMFLTFNKFSLRCCGHRRGGGAHTRKILWITLPVKVERREILAKLQLQCSPRSHDRFDCVLAWATSILHACLGFENGDQIGQNRGLRPRCKGTPPLKKIFEFSEKRRVQWPMT